MSKRILLIDGDVVVYRNSAAVEKRSIIVKHLASGRTKAFDNRTAFKAFLKDKEFPYDPAKYEISDHQEAADVSIAYNIIDKLIRDLTTFCWADEVEVWVGESGNTFRHKLSLPSPYKANRGELIKPIHLESCKKYLAKRHGARMSDNLLETDDMLTIRCYEELEKGNYPIMATIDKDAGQTQGVAVLNIMEDPWNIVEIPYIGEVFKHKTTYKGNGLKFLAFQTLVGDATDTYCSYELSKIGYGPAKAVAALKDCNTEKEILEAVLKEFQRLYPSAFRYVDCNNVVVEADWLFMLEMYWKCAYMKRSRNDPSSFVDFAKERGVEF
jgi:hypothetical protein